MEMEINEKLKKQILAADSLLNKNKPLEAVLILKEMTKEFPDFPYLHYLLGIARTKCGLFHLGKRDFEKADKLDPNNSENLRSLGWAKIMLGEAEDGRNDLRCSINLNLTNPLPYLDLAKSYFDCFDFDEAFAWYDRAKALNPKDKFILENYRFAEEMRNSFFNLSKKDQEMAKKEDTGPKMRKETQLFILRRVFSDEGFNENKISELKEELDLSGLSDKMLIYRDDIGKNETKESIYKKQTETEKRLSALIKESKSKLTIDNIKEIIYREKDHHELDKILTEFDCGQDLKEINIILQIINDAWNYFPHKCLGGLSPAEKILEHQKK